MSTVIELSEDMAKSLDERSREEQVTREELIRRVLASYLTPCHDDSVRMVLETGEDVSDSLFEQKAPRAAGEAWPELDAAFGLWKGRAEDGLAYQLRVRDEWPD